MLLRKVPATSAPCPSPSRKRGIRGWGRTRNLPEMETICVLFSPFPHQAPLPGQPASASLAWLVFLGGELINLTLPQPPFTPHLILHTHPQRSLRGTRGSTIDRIHHPQVMGHQPPLFCFYLHAINHLFLVICMATLLHLAAQEFPGFIASINLDLLGCSGSPCRPTTDGALKPACLCSLGSLSSHRSSLPVSKPGSAYSAILQRMGRRWAMAGSGGCQSCKGLKDCLVHSGPPYFTPISQIGEPEHGKGLPMVKPQVRHRAGSRCWDSPPSAHFVNKKQLL